VSIHVSVVYTFLYTYCIYILVRSYKENTTSKCVHVHFFQLYNKIYNNFITIIILQVEN